MNFLSVILTLTICVSAFAGDHREPEHAITQVGNRVYPEATAPRIRAVTFNMAAARVATINTIATALKAMDADIIAIQEVDRKTRRSGGIDQPDVLQKSTGMNVSFQRSIQFEGGEYGLAIASRHPITNVQAIQLSSSDQEQRIVMKAEISVPGFDNPVIVFNTHLDNSENPELRVKQARQLNKHTINTRGIKLLMGDINDVPQTDTYRELLRYWNGSWDHGEDARSWPSANPEIGVDYILTSKAQRWKITRAQIPNKDGHWAGIHWPTVTDHLPVIVDMTLLEQ